MSDVKKDLPPRLYFLSLPGIFFSAVSLLRFIHFCNIFQPHISNTLDVLLSSEPSLFITEVKLPSITLPSKFFFSQSPPKTNKKNHLYYSFVKSLQMQHLKFKISFQRLIFYPAQVHLSNCCSSKKVYRPIAWFCGPNTEFPFLFLIVLKRCKCDDGIRTVLKQIKWCSLGFSGYYTKID